MIQLLKTCVCLYFIINDESSTSSSLTFCWRITLCSSPTISQATKGPWCRQPAKHVHEKFAAIPDFYTAIPIATLIILGKTNHALHLPLPYGWVFAIQPSRRQGAAMKLGNAFCWHNSSCAAGESVPSPRKIGVTLQSVITEVVSSSVELAQLAVIDTFFGNVLCKIRNF